MTDWTNTNRHTVRPVPNSRQQKNVVAILPRKIVSLHPTTNKIHICTDFIVLRFINQPHKKF